MVGVGGWDVEVLILIFLKTVITLVSFRRGGGSGLPEPPTSLWIHNSEIKRIGRNNKCSPNIRLFDNGCKLASLIIV